jgi:serine/threonine-protein kinase
MGSLYLAWDPVLERQIAIKLLREDMEELRERFDREARSVARLRHPNIVTIFDVGEHDGQPFIAMEYIHGKTLAEIIRTDPQPSVSRKLTIIDELCDGLGFAHKMAIIHRDVKPANVMVENEGGVKVLDFGIARVAESGMTMAGMLIGTLNYMSPEQVSGQVVDNRSDIFAIGAVMYELLSQRQAFPGGLQNGIIHRILNEPPAPLEAFCPRLDEEVIEVVRRALEKDPQARYQDLAAMRRDVQRVRLKVDALGETVAVNPDTSGETVLVERPEKKSSHPGRRGTPREALARLRATQLAVHLEAAQRALDSGDYPGAVSSAEHALLLSPDDPTAAEIIDRARAVLMSSRCRTWSSALPS